MFLRKDEKIQKAFRRAIEKTPLLQTKIVGQEQENEPPFFFRQIVTPEEWPSIKITSLAVAPSNSKSQDEQSALLNEARFIMVNDVDRFNQSIENRRKAPCFTMVRGRFYLAFSIAVPHAFADAAGGFGFFKKFLFYAALPRPLWKATVDRWSNDMSVPTFEEMVLKNRYHLWREDEDRIDLAKCERYDPANFSFPSYKESHLGGLDFERVGQIDNAKQVLKPIRLKLRQSGSTLTHAFSAVAMKLLAYLIKDSFESPGPLCFTTSVNPRSLGAWGDERDNHKCLHFPVMANLTFMTFTQIPLDDLQSDTLEQIAARIKRSAGRIFCKDANFLMQEMKATSTPANHNYYCGCSSVVVSSTGSRLGLAPAHFESGIRFGRFSRCWITAITFGDRMQVTADVMLPIPGLTDKMVREAIATVIKGSAIEPLFNRCNA